MKAQASVEFLLNFLAFLVVISLLLASFSKLLAASSVYDWKMREKAKIEQFARALDQVECTGHSSAYIPANYSAGDVDREGAISGEANGETILGYTIYGIGGTNGEPV